VAEEGVEVEKTQTKISNSSTIANKAMSSTKREEQMINTSTQKSKKSLRRGPVEVSLSSMGSRPQSELINQGVSPLRESQKW
jgi:hypothetical protein